MNFILTIFGLVVAVVSIVLGISAKSKERAIAPFITTFVCGLAILIAANTFVVIPTGYTGVKSSFGQIQQMTLQNGLNFKIPFVQSIELVNNKQQDISFAKKNQVWGETSEKVPVYMADVTVTYQIDNEKSAWIFANVSDYRNALINESIVASALKDAAVQFTAEEVTVRSNIEPAAQVALQISLDEKYGKDVVHISKIVINDMDFEDSYNEAINQKNLAAMNQEAQAIQNQTELEKANKDAEVKRITAQAEADAKIVAAQGEADALEIRSQAEAEANARLSQSLTENILSNKFYEKWNGELPTVMGNETNTLATLPIE